MNKNFRLDINGLRAYAVLLVVLFHFQILGFKAGFIGVDIFFVISGYLMTKIITQGLHHSSFSLVNFYMHRAIRIIPALTILCLICAIAGWFVLLPIEYKNLGKHILGSILFISNIIYWRESGYFDVDSHNKILLHTWSLSVEWQFYLLLPIFLMFAYRISKNSPRSSIFLLFLLSFGASSYFAYTNPSLSFYLLPTRAWEMLLGGLICFLPNIKSSKYLEYIGFVLILIALFLFSSQSAWPGINALLPTLGAALILLANNQQSILTSNKVAQSIGSASYSIYLWHWPIVFIIYNFGSLADPKQVLAGILSAILLGYLSFYCVEKPTAKFFKNIKISVSFVSISVLSIVALLCAIAIFRTNGFNVNYRAITTTKKAQYIEKYLAEEMDHREAFWLQCNTYANLTQKKFNDIDKSCISAPYSDKSIFLWGDSHSQALSKGFRENFKSYSFYQVGSSGCPASLQPNQKLKAEYKVACDKANNLAITYIKQLRPHTVIIAQANSHDKNNWTEIINELKNAHVKQIIVLGPVPQWKPSLLKVYSKSINFMADDTRINDAGLDLSIIQTDNKAKNIFKQLNDPSVLYISLVDQMCSLKTDKKYYCQAVIPDTKGLLQYDYGHLTKEGSIYIVKNYIKPYISK